MEQYIWPATVLVVFCGMLALSWRSLSIAHDLAKVVLQNGLGPTLREAPVARPVQPQPAQVPQATPPAKPESKPPTEYDKMWQAMQVLPEHQAVIDRDAAKILTHKAQYEEASQQSGVPWYVIGLIDMMEAGGGCDAHLHNGDPLKNRTIHVPAGRPPAPQEPPFTWLQSALDALQYEGFDKIKSWPVSAIAGALEKYNGMGYHMRGIPSPYLWSFSNQYHSGKFVADHVFDPNAVSQQAGAMPMLKSLMAQDSSINL